MIHISVIELGVVCSLGVIVLFLPLIVRSSYARLQKRIKNIEDKLSKKS
ncbi:MAG: hypothetical protein JNK32_00885 [Anaerolineales bacterium]|nr:hypothetical protein [Anaerolineales bacterium]